MVCCQVRAQLVPGIRDAELILKFTHEFSEYQNGGSVINYWILSHARQRLNCCASIDVIRKLKGVLLLTVSVLHNQSNIEYITDFVSCSLFLYYCTITILQLRLLYLLLYLGPALWGRDLLCRARCNPFWIRVLYRIFSYYCTWAAIRWWVRAWARLRWLRFRAGCRAWAWIRNCWRLLFVSRPAIRPRMSLRCRRDRWFRARWRPSLAAEFRRPEWRLCFRKLRRRRRRRRLDVAASWIRSGRRLSCWISSCASSARRPGSTLLACWSPVPGAARILAMMTSNWRAECGFSCRIRAFWSAEGCRRRSLRCSRFRTRTMSGSISCSCSADLERL